MPHEGEEFGFLLEGEITLHLSSKKYIVKEHQAFYYAASKTHYVENHSDKIAKIIWVSSSPNF